MAQALALRSRIVLGCGEGLDNKTVAERSGLSKSTIGRSRKAFELKPDRQDGFKLSNDPQFVEKVYDVIGLYLNPPEAVVVLCVDEKHVSAGFGEVPAGVPDDAGIGN